MAAHLPASEPAPGVGAEPSQARRQIAAEVLELGEALFDAANAAAARRPTEAPDEAYPEGEVRAAADQCCTALRLPLGPAVPLGPRLSAPSPRPSAHA